MFRKYTILTAFGHIISLTNGSNVWPIDKSEPINPHVMRRSIHHLKKN